jgi:hypothetical protein
MTNSADVCTGPGCWDQMPYVGLAVGGGSAPPRPPEPPAEPEVQHAPALDVLTDDARDAAIHGRCDLVRRIDAELARAAPDYHAHVFLADGAITACLDPASGG